MTHAIELRNVYREFQQRGGVTGARRPVRAVDGVTFSLPAGDVLTRSARKSGVRDVSRSCYVIKFLGEGLAAYVDCGIHEVFTTTGDLVAVAMWYWSNQAVSTK